MKIILGAATAPKLQAFPPPLTKPVGNGLTIKVMALEGTGAQAGEIATLLK